MFSTLGDTDGITLWDSRLGAPLSLIPDRRRGIKQVRFADEYVLAAATESEVFIWDAVANEKRSTISLGDTKFQMMALSDDGRFVAIAPRDRGN